MRKGIVLTATVVLVGASIAVTVAVIDPWGGSGGRYVEPKPAYTTVAGDRIPVMQMGRCVYGIGARHERPARAARFSCAPSLHVGADGRIAPPGCESATVPRSATVGRLLAVGRPGDRYTEARTIEGIDADDLVALRGCSPPRWLVASGVHSRRTRGVAAEGEVYADALARCVVLGRDSPWCNDDREIPYPAGSGEVEGYLYLPWLVEQVNAAPPPDRLTAVDTVAAWTRERDGSCDGYPLCRAGMRVLSATTAEAVVRVVRQTNGNPKPAEPVITQSETTYTARRIAGGRAWFVVRSAPAGLREFGSDRRAADAAWHGCCDRILIDRG